MTPIFPDRDGQVVPAGARLVWWENSRGVDYASVDVLDAAGASVAFSWDCSFGVCAATLDDPALVGSTLTLVSLIDDYGADESDIEFVYGGDGTFPVPVAPTVQAVTFMYDSADDSTSCGPYQDEFSVTVSVDAPWEGDGAGVVEIFLDDGTLWGRGTAGQGQSVWETLGVETTSLCVYAVTYNGQGQASEPSATVCGEGQVPGPDDDGLGGPTSNMPRRGGCSTLPDYAALPGMLLALLAVPRRRSRSDR